MKPCAAPVALVRRAWSASLALSVIAAFAFSAPALAGDRALLDPIGFSADGKVLAFEEFGVQDGSGFAYSSIYVVDLAADKWIAGSPFRARSDDEEAPLAAIRAETRARLAPVLTQFDISVPAEILAINGDADPDTDLTRLSFGMPMSGPKAIHDPRTLTLETFDARSAEPCADYMDEKPKGFALTLALEGEEREIYRDGDLPKSRSCPLDYGLYAVVTPFGDYGFESAVALVSNYTLGFEGPDRRFVAVPLGNP